MVYVEQSGSKPNELYKAVSKGGAGVPADTFQRRDASTIPAHAAGKHCCRGQPAAKDRELRREASQISMPRTSIRCYFQIHGGPEGDWGETWTLSLECASIRGGRIRRGHAESARLYRLRAGVHRCCERRLGRRAVSGHYGVRTNIVENLPYIDKDRMFAAGASYGGYMIDWILGHTDRFKRWFRMPASTICEAKPAQRKSSGSRNGNFKAFRGKTRTLYEKWSPSMFVKKFKTPTLVTAWRTRLSCADRTGSAALHSAAGDECALKTGAVPRRRSLDYEATE